MADTGVVNLDSDLVGLWWRDLDRLESEWLTGLPGNRGFAGDGLEVEPSKC